MQKHVSILALSLLAALAVGTPAQAQDQKPKKPSNLRELLLA